MLDSHNSNILISIFKVGTFEFYAEYAWSLSFGYPEFLCSFSGWTQNSLASDWLFTRYLIATSRDIGQIKIKLIYRVSQKSVICSAWCKIVPFLCNCTCMVFFNTIWKLYFFFGNPMAHKKIGNLFFSQNQFFNINNNNMHFWVFYLRIRAVVCTIRWNLKKFNFLKC